jgi:hypothetical protein
MKLLWFLVFCMVAAAALDFAKTALTPVQCTVDRAPVITVHYASAPVKYDFSRSAMALTRMRSDTNSPYGPGVVTQTEGLRMDTPTIYTKTWEQVTNYPLQHEICVSYDKVDVKIALKPTIFIASKWKPGPCKSAILGHEEKHIRVDHEIMNDVVPQIRQKVEAAVADIGAVGPLDQSQEDKTSKFMTDHVDVAVNALMTPMHEEMVRLQGQVDSLQEYQRVSAICNQEENR